LGTAVLLWTRGAGGGRGARCAALWLIKTAIRGTAAAWATAEHLHVAGDNFGAVLIDPFLVLPFARAQRTFDIDLLAFAQVFGADFRQFIEQHHAVPFGGFLLLAGLLVLPLLGGGEVQIGDRAAAGHVAGFRVAPQGAD